MRTRAGVLDCRVCSMCGRYGERRATKCRFLSPEPSLSGPWKFRAVAADAGRWEPGGYRGESGGVRGAGRRFRTGD
ncbi:MAG: hypothetical protein L6W00_06685 [Lentisphaeria bacterium]|nr:MAG: hypothetical protein L6W00_06685 [Lentisphaeria bacterium]